MHLKCNFCIFFHICWLSAENLNISFPKVSSNMPKVRWVMSYLVCSKFHTLSNSQQFWKSVKIWQRYREFKGGNFFETQCRSTDNWLSIIMPRPVTIESKTWRSAGVEWQWAWQAAVECHAKSSICLLRVQLLFFHHHQSAHHYPPVEMPDTINKSKWVV